MDTQAIIIPITPKGLEKTSPISLASLYCHIPFELCNSLTMFEKCVVIIFLYMVEYFLEILMNGLFMFGDSFDECLHYFEIVLRYCHEKN